MEQNNEKKCRKNVMIWHDCASMAEHFQFCFKTCKNMPLLHTETTIIQEFFLNKIISDSIFFCYRTGLFVIEFEI